MISNWGEALTVYGWKGKRQHLDNYLDDYMKYEELPGQLSLDELYGQADCD